jgi:hypothetical protein
MHSCAGGYLKVIVHPVFVTLRVFTRETRSRQVLAAAPITPSKLG